MGLQQPPISQKQVNFLQSRRGFIEKPLEPIRKLPQEQIKKVAQEPKKKANPEPVVEMPNLGESDILEIFSQEYENSLRQARAQKLQALINAIAEEGTKYVMIDIIIYGCLNKHHLTARQSE